MKFIKILQMIPPYGYFEDIKQSYGTHILYRYKYLVHARDGSYVAAWNKKEAIKACEVYDARYYTHMEARRTYRIKD